MSRERLMQVLLGPHITEKSTKIAEKKNKQIAFKVLRNAAKEEIKAAVELMFNVKVSAVQTINQKGKKCRFGTREGKHQDWKKAYVVLQEGYDINFGGAE